MPRYLLGLLLLFSSAAWSNNWFSNAQLLAAKGDDAGALVELWAGFAEQGPQNQQQAMLLAADLCTRNGLTELARSYYLRLLNDELSSGDRYGIARFFADQKEWQRVSEALSPFWQNFPTQLRRQARNLIGYAQLQNQQPQQARNTLAFPRHYRLALPYRRHNLAVAQHQLGKTFEARKALHALLENPASTLEQAIFKDRLRVALAQHYLSYEQGAFATPLLENIKYQSPYANRALLMLGWAALTPGGERPACQSLAASQGCWIETDEQGRDQQRSRTSISQTFAELRPKRGQQLDLQNQPNLQQAITSWALVADKPQPKLSPFSHNETLAQLEAKVSLGFALQIAGQQQLALKRYQQALAALSQHRSAPLVTNQQESLLQKLGSLKQRMQQQAKLAPALKAKALTAIDNAIRYRQDAIRGHKQARQTAWDQKMHEYKKQAHLGLASLHEELSYAHSQ